MELQVADLRVTCILTSYNRPRMVRQALGSVARQTHRNHELLVFDDSTIFDVREAVAEFHLPSVRVFHTDVGPERRARENRLGVNCNRGLAEATGDLVCFLADDDFFFPTWFTAAVRFMADKPAIAVCYGRLSYSTSPQMEYPRRRGQDLFPGKVLDDPRCQVDHNQVMHRNFQPPFRWPEEFGATMNCDALYFYEISRKHTFHPLDAPAAVKRMHQKNLQRTLTDVQNGAAEGTRE